MAFFSLALGLIVIKGLGQDVAEKAYQVHAIYSQKCSFCTFAVFKPMDSSSIFFIVHQGLADGNGIIVRGF